MLFQKTLFVFPVALFFAVATGDSQSPAESPSAIGGPDEPSPPTQAAPPSTREVVETPLSFMEVGAEGIWDPLEQEDILLQIQGCHLPRPTQCTFAAMEKAGASPEAMNFFRLTGWFLADFQEMGQVDLGSILDPWRANSNGDFSILNGTPAVVILEEEGGRIEAAIQNDPNYDALIASFPSLRLWSTDNVFESLDASPQGGQRFIFQFYLVNGCHACVTGYMARVALDFASDGTYYSFPRLLGLCRANWAQGTSVADAVPDCPAPAEAAPSEAIPDFSAPP